MPNDSTLNDLTSFSRNEKNILRSLGLAKDEKENAESGCECGPEADTMRNIMNYSRVLSVRKSKHIGFVEFILN